MSGNDVVIAGSGSAGVAAAIAASRFGVPTNGKAVENSFASASFRSMHLDFDATFRRVRVSH
jgi:thioredoxin reductase